LSSETLFTFTKQYFPCLCQSSNVLFWKVAIFQTCSGSNNRLPERWLCGWQVIIQA
jgi:hypothetical protein